MRTLAETRYSLTPDESFMSEFLRILADVPWVCQDRAALEFPLQILARPPALIFASFLSSLHSLRSCSLARLLSPLSLAVAQHDVPPVREVCILGFGEDKP